MDDDQFSDMLTRVNKNQEVILPTFSQIVILSCIFVGSLIFIYYVSL